MSIESDKTRVLIATTSGPVEVLLLTEEDEAIGRSVACVGGTTDTADIDAAYHAFVARPTGLVARLFGHPCFRIDLSARIDAGSSWQLGVLTAHALHAAGRLAQEKDIAGSVLWATGAVRSVDLTVSAISHLDEKLAQSLDRLKREAEAGRHVLVVVPSANSREVAPEIRATLATHGIEILEIAHVQSLWGALKLRVETVQPASEKDGWSRTTRWLQKRWLLGLGAGAIALVALAGGFVVDWPNWWQSENSRDVRSELTSALARSIPNAPLAYRALVTENFVKSKSNRAMAVAARIQKTMRVSGWASRELAEEKVLERCQQFYDEPCALIVVNDVVVTTSETLVPKDAPRVRYAGPFDPERIPGVGQSVRRRPDVVSYLIAAGPKATAFHASGILHVVTGASSQYAAEEQALRACNGDPEQKSSGGPCYLYSVENRVVLTLRSTVPITQAVSAPLPHDLLLTLLSKIAPNYPFSYRLVREYLESKPHKALAAFPPSNFWRIFTGETATTAEERVLEGCQLRYARPCILLAVDDAIRITQSTEHQKPRSMRRVSYQGIFDPEQIPIITDATRHRSDVENYRAAAAYKAAAIHPWGRIFLVVQKTTQRAAEQSSLDACNGDSDRGGKDGRCLLYAVGDVVVLPKRLTTPLTPE